MPTYTVTNSNFNLSSKQQKNLAEGITKVHNVVTGANTYFAQVIFNKTKKNISENPHAFATVVNPGNLQMFNLELQFDHTETEGDLFVEMDMKLEAIASMTGMSGIFKLMGADVYKVISIRPIGA